MTPGTKLGTSGGPGTCTPEQHDLQVCASGSAHPLLMGSKVGLALLPRAPQQSLPMPWGKRLDVLLLPCALLTSSLPPWGKHGHVPLWWC